MEFHENQLRELNRISQQFKELEELSAQAGVNPDQLIPEMEYPDVFEHRLKNVLERNLDRKDIFKGASGTANRKENSSEPEIFHRMR
jgi:hypothetical protein